MNTATIEKSLLLMPSSKASMAVRIQRRASSDEQHLPAKSILLYSALAAVLAYVLQNIYEKRYAVLKHFQRVVLNLFGLRAHSRAAWKILAACLLRSMHVQTAPLCAANAAYMVG